MNPTVPLSEGIFSPVMSDTLLMISMIFSVLLLVGVAYVFAQIRSITPFVKTTEKLQAEVRRLQKEVEALKGTNGQPLSAPAKASAPAPISQKDDTESTAPPKPSAPWQPFVDDYNHLAGSMDIPKADVACGNFIAMHQLTEIPCIFMEGESYVPKATGEAVCWAAKFPGQEGKYIAVPNLTRGYDEAGHKESGMKETFASNFEKGAYRHIKVKLPAILRIKDGKWFVEQAGVLRLEL